MPFFRYGLVSLLMCSATWADDLPAPSFSVCYAQLTDDKKSVESTRGHRVFDQLYRQLNDALIQSGRTFTVQALPWKRCVHLVGQGGIDAALPVIWSKEREAWASFPRTDDGELDRSLRLRAAEYFVYVPVQTQEIHKPELQWNGQSFRSVKYGVWAPVGYKSYEKLKQLKVLNSERYGFDEAFNMLVHYRLDGLVAERNEADSFIEELALQGRVKVLKRPFFHEDWFLVMSHQFVEKNPTDAMIIWRLSAEGHSYSTGIDD